MPDLQSDQFQTLLADALRSGPGSPQWHQAVRLVRGGGAGGDEYALLIAAREHLESGKDFRSVRAGPGFTRRLMEGLKDEKDAGGGGRGFFSANVIALISAGVILAVVAVVGIVLFHGGDPNRVAIDDLANTYFGQPLLPPEKFESALPADWKKIGDLPLLFKAGLRPGAGPPATASTSPAAGEYRTGGIVVAAPFPADQPLAFNVTFRLSPEARPGDKGAGKRPDAAAGKPADVIAQVFLSDEPVEGQGGGPHEVVWQLKGGEASAYVSGQTAPRSEKVTKAALSVRVAANRDTAVVESDGVRLYAGPHQLDRHKPRYLGVRFLRADGGDGDPVVLTAAGVQKP